MTAEPITTLVNRLKAHGLTQLTEPEQQALTERIARIIDPDDNNKWWEHGHNVDGTPSSYCTGPRFLDPTDGEAQRVMREWLEDRRIQVLRELDGQSSKSGIVTQVYKQRLSPDMREGMRKYIVRNEPDYSTALATAVLEVGG